MKCLEVLPIEYKYLFLEEKYTNNANFECKLRLRSINTEELARQWIDDLSRRSMVTWKIARTYPKSGKINIYKAEFRCQHKVSGKQKSIKRSKHTNCQALLRVCIKRYVKGSASKEIDPLTRLWPCIIEVRNVHNHSIYSADSLQYRPIQTDTKEKLGQLFQVGHSPSSAVEMLKIEIMLNSPEEYAAKAMDTSFVPHPSFCYREYTKVFGHNYRLRDKNKTMGELELLLGTYINEAHGGRAGMTIEHDHVIVVICTPIMQRVHKLVPESKDLAFLRVYGHIDKKTRLFLLSTQTSLGELPLGCIVADTENQDVFRTGMIQLLKVFPPDSFYGAGFPATIIMDEDPRRKIALEQVFPSSLVISNQLNVLRQVWDWLTDERNGVEKSSRQVLYKKFKSMVYAKDEQDLQTKYMACLTPMTREETCEPFFNFVNNIWPDHIEWSSAFRDDTITGITAFRNANYFPDIIARILDENIIQPTQTFSLLQLTHFAITHLETYWERRLTASVFDKYIEYLLRIFLPSKGLIPMQKIRKLERALYLVPSESGTAPVKTVDLDLGLCTCSVGCTRKICKHQAAVVDKYNIGQSVFSLMPGSAERKLFLEVGGVTEPDHEYSPIVASSLQSEYLSLKEKFSPKKKFNMPGKQLISKRRKLDIRATDNYAEATEAELEEGKRVAFEVGCWLTTMLSTNPLKFIPAMKTMYRNINELRTEDAAAAAMHQFGKDAPVTTYALIPSSPTHNEGMNLGSEEQTTEISFISHHPTGLEVEEEMELVPVDEAFVPVQTLERAGGQSPRYLILVGADGNLEVQPQNMPLSMATTTSASMQMNGQLLFTQSRISEVAAAAGEDTDQHTQFLYSVGPQESEQELLDTEVQIQPQL